MLSEPRRASRFSLWPEIKQVEDCEALSKSLTRDLLQLAGLYLKISAAGPASRPEAVAGLASNLMGETGAAAASLDDVVLGRDILLKVLWSFGLWYYNKCESFD